MRSIVILFSCLLYLQANAQGYLKVSGKAIRDADNNEVILRGIGLGGWMLQEPYMLKLSGVATAQYDIRKKISAVIGEAGTRKFYDAWLDNHCTKADVDSLASWGFNSIRLPIHYNLFTLASEKEPVAGKNTWLSKGFNLTDSLVKWCTDNHMYLILDLHATPGGQGNDNAIADRDPSLSSLWRSEANRKKTIALWQKLASRYVNEKWIGGYDLINEPNWGFQDASDKNGCAELVNKELKELLQQITIAIRKVDKNHIIFIEGNCWANNYSGMFPLWDHNMVISFHKYWNYTDKASIQKFLDYRDTYNVPVWLGETGENSNAWFTGAITLLENNKIGWAMWPLKKSGLNNPLQVKIGAGAQNLFEYWNGRGVKPSAMAAFQGLMELAHNSNIKNCIIHRDVIDAMMRQVRSAEVIPFKENKIKPNSILFASDYDMGRSGIAYHDKDSAEYWVSTSKRTPWNIGGQYRNDGVDIEQCKDAVSNGFNVGWIESGEWLQYSLYVPADEIFDVAVRTASVNDTARLKLIVNSAGTTDIRLPRTGGQQSWKTSMVKNIKLNKGWNQLRVYAASGGFNLNYLQFIATDNTAKLN